MDVDEVPVACVAGDAQHVCHGAPTRDQDRANQQKLGVAPGAMDEQRRERQDDPGEAGRQRWHGGVSCRKQRQPTRHARFVTSAHTTRRKWPKSSLESGAKPFGLSLAGEGAGEGSEGQVDAGASLVPNGEATEACEPCQDTEHPEDVSAAKSTNELRAANPIWHLAAPSARADAPGAQIRPSCVMGEFSGISTPRQSMWSEAPDAHAASA